VHDEEASFRLVHVYEVLHTCPQWLSNAMKAMQASWKDDKFEVLLILMPNSPRPKWRIKCLDCPGKLYLTGPGETLQNYEVHVKNRLHRMRVRDRMGNSSNS
jgi:SWI/SNF-related matrix-associated actin-dependent regulator of chromatin subfamily B protein 1